MLFKQAATSIASLSLLLLLLLALTDLSCAKQHLKGSRALKARKRAKKTTKRRSKYWTKSDYNCGWDITKEIPVNNAYKYVCQPECTNSHDGADVQHIGQCIDICNRAPFNVCGGFSFFQSGILGADGLSHGSTKPGDIGSCYFRSADWMHTGLDYDGVTCFARGPSRKYIKN